MRLTQVACLRRLPVNTTGRDFVVGDLHGHRRPLEKALTHLGFNTQVDRVISVGDLVDRGPQSLDTLALIEEPWFHAVLGNHELMMLNHLGFYRSHQYDRHDYAAKKGAWLIQALHTQRRRTWALAERAAALPLAIHVEGPEPFVVMHGDLYPLEARREPGLASPTVDIHMAERLTTSRRHLQDVLATRLLDLPFDGKPIRVSPMPKGAAPLTYVGHSPMPLVTVHNSHVYVDQGLGRVRSKPDPIRLPTVIEHRPFAWWLDGVCAAHRAPGADGSRLKERALDAIA